MEKISENLTWLVQEACKYPPGHRQRQKLLTQIIRLVNRKLWRENTAYYEDALQETWIYFCQNICEQKTAKQYDSNKASIVTWLNNYLKWRLKDGYIQTEKQKKYKASVRVDKNNKIIDPVENLPSKLDSVAILQEIEEWVINDPEQKLRYTNLAKYPQISCQLLILKRLPSETSWKNLAKEYGISPGTLSSFYQRKCKPLLREFSKSQGYI